MMANNFQNQSSSESGSSGSGEDGEVNCPDRSTVDSLTQQLKALTSPSKAGSAVSRVTGDLKSVEQVEERMMTRSLKKRLASTSCPPEVSPSKKPKGVVSLLAKRKGSGLNEVSSKRSRKATSSPMMRSKKRSKSERDFKVRSQSEPTVKKKRGHNSVDDISSLVSGLFDSDYEEYLVSRGPEAEPTRSSEENKLQERLRTVYDRLLTSPSPSPPPEDFRIRKRFIRQRNSRPSPKGGKISSYKVLRALFRSRSEMKQVGSSGNQESQHQASSIAPDSEKEATNEASVGTNESSCENSAQQLENNCRDV